MYLSKNNSEVAHDYSLKFVTLFNSALKAY